MRSWLEQYPTEEDLSLRKGLPPLSLADTKDFLRFYAAGAEGRLDPRITVESLNAVAEWFFAAFTRATGTVLDPEYRSAVYKVVLSL